MSVTGYDRHATVAETFRSVAAHWPDHVALVQEREEISYRRLDRRSDQAAARLAQLGVQPGDRVALHLERSISTIVVMIGVLKAGAVYVPLDAAHPPERLRTIVDDCEPALVVAEQEGAGHLFGTRPVALVRDLLEPVQAADALPTGRGRTAEDPAYIMYTSGSTGRPKGVVVTHRGIVRLVRGQSYAPFGPQQTFLHLAPLAFDACTFEIWGALLNGGCLAIMAEPRPSLAAIGDAVARHRVTVAWFTAGLFHLLVDHGLEDFGSLRCLLAGGDVLSPRHVARAQEALPQCQLVNGYGPTENTTFTCCYPVPRDGSDRQAVPIGPPIAHGEVLVLDADLRPVANGEAGQICAAGDGLAQGYLNLPDMTADRFVDGPNGRRLYLTGDLGRRLPDGALEFCGRIDRQVKIDGKRIELDEIEHALRADSDIADAVVTVRESEGQRKRLCAHVKPKRPWLTSMKAARGRDLQARLRRHLPAYMIPADVVAIDAFPLTPNGKVDRDRLPSPVTAAAAALQPRRPSDDDLVTMAVTEAWRSVLGIAAPDPMANFFDLGGTSLQLMAVHAGLVARLGPGIPLLTLFQHTTIRDLAAFLQGRGNLADAAPHAKASGPPPHASLAELAGEIR